MKLLSGAVLFFVLMGSALQAFDRAGKEKDQLGKDQPDNWSISGFRDVAAEREVEKKFMAVPDPKLAEEHLRILTEAPPIAGSPEDKATAEHVDGDPFQDDPRIVNAYNGMSPSGDAEADVVYANYGSPADFDKLKEMNVDVRGKIVIVRYGENFRGVKAFVAQERGAAGVILYSDPKDDGYYRGDSYPKGPWRPASGVQRGSIGYMFQFPGDPTTPGVASTPALPDSKRVSPAASEQLPKIPVTPLSYADASPILDHLGGPASPRECQGALPFTY